MRLETAIHSILAEGFAKQGESIDETAKPIANPVKDSKGLHNSPKPLGQASVKELEASKKWYKETIEKHKETTPSFAVRLKQLLTLVNTELASRIGKKNEEVELAEDRYDNAPDEHVEKIVSWLKSRPKNANGGHTEKEIAAATGLTNAEVKSATIKEWRKFKNSKLSAWANQNPSVSTEKALKGPLYHFYKANYKTGVSEEVELDEGVGEYSVKKTGSSKAKKGEEEYTITKYSILKGNTAVGELTTDDYFGYIDGKLHGKQLPELSSYGKGKSSGPLSSLHAFLKSATGVKWAKNVKEDLDEANTNWASDIDANYKKLVKEYESYVSALKKRLADEEKEYAGAGRDDTYSAGAGSHVQRDRIKRIRTELNKAERDLKDIANPTRRLREDTDLDEAVAKIACLECDEVSTAAAWKKNRGFCPKCKVSNKGVAEEVELDEAVFQPKLKSLGKELVGHANNYADAANSNNYQIAKDAINEVSAITDDIVNVLRKQKHESVELDEVYKTRSPKVAKYMAQLDAMNGGEWFDFWKSLLQYSEEMANVDDWGDDSDSWGIIASHLSKIVKEYQLNVHYK